MRLDFAEWRALVAVEAAVFQQQRAHKIAARHAARRGEESWPVFDGYVLDICLTDVEPKVLVALGLHGMLTRANERWAITARGRKFLSTRQTLKKDKA